MPPTPTATPDGDKARELRLDQGLSIAKVAHLIDRNESTVRRVESGKPTSLTILGQLAMQYGVNRAELIQPDVAAEQVV